MFSLRWISFAQSRTGDDFICSLKLKTSLSSLGKLFKNEYDENGWLQIMVAELKRPLAQPECSSNCANNK